MDDGRAYFEIAEQGHCGVCKGRIRDIEKAVASNQVDVRYDYLQDRYPADANTLWVGVEISKEATDSDIRKLFREKLNLSM
jgi:Tfp pilus assembly protein PilF